MESGSSTPTNTNIYYHQPINGMTTLVPPNPPPNPGHQMYPVHPIQNPGFWVHQSSGIYNTPFSNHMNTCFGQEQNGHSYRQLHAGINPAGYQMHQIQQGSGFLQNPATDGAPFNYDWFVYPYNYIHQQTYPVNQPAAQAPPQQVQAERTEGEEVLVVEAEQPLFPMTSTTSSRLRWTPELERRFARAVEELGGCFNAIPEKILGLMNVVGITLEELTSQLQRVRNHILYHQSAVENMGPDHQDNTTIGSPQSSESDEEYLNIAPPGEPERLLRSFESVRNDTLYNQSAVENMSHGSPQSSESDEEYWNIAPPGEPERLLRSFETASNIPNHRILPVYSQTKNDNTDVGIALVIKDPSSSSKLKDFDWAQNDTEEFGFASFEDPDSYSMSTISHGPYHN